MNNYYNMYNPYKFRPSNYNTNYYYNNPSNNINNNTQDENIIEMNNFKNNNQKKEKSWFEISNGKIKLFNFNIESDDILLGGLIIFLLLQKEKDYILIIVIGLMILNLSINDLKDLNFLKDLPHFF